MVLEKQQVQNAVDMIKRKVKEEQQGITTFFDNIILQEGVNVLEGKQLPDSEKSVLKRALHTLSISESNRYIDIPKRITNMPVSDLDGYARICSQGTNNVMRWRGKALFKSVFDMAIYQMMINDIRPSTIIEIGSTEASLTWLKDTAELNKLNPRVVGIDQIEPETIPTGVEFFKGDIQNITQFLSDKFIKSLPKPLLIIEDAHVYLKNTLQFFGEIMIDGDYLVVEDSLLKQKSLLQWAETQGNNYYVDTKYTDFFGINSTTAANSILIKRGIES
jgi:cephalosporin hydroxylase